MKRRNYHNNELYILCTLCYVGEIKTKKSDVENTYHGRRKTDMLCKGGGTMLHVGRSRVRVPMRSLDFSLDLILLVTL
jgi:hypothetical protein